MFLRVGHLDDVNIGPHYKENDPSFILKWRGPKKSPSFIRPEKDELLKEFWKKIYNKNKMLFGFSNKNQFEQWFYKKEWRQALHQEGFVLYEFPIYGEEKIDYQHGKTQAISHLILRDLFNIRILFHFRTDSFFLLLLRNIINIY